MEFSVPQFIEQAPKIVGPLTWRQFLFIGGAAAIIFVFYFVIKNFFFFLLVSLFVIGLGTIFAFAKVEGRNVITVLANFIAFSVSSKLYVWRKKAIQPQITFKKEEVEIEEETGKTSPLKISKRSKLRDLSTQIETRTK